MSPFFVVDKLGLDNYFFGLEPPLHFVNGCEEAGTKAETKERQ